MLKSPISERDLRSLSGKNACDNRTQQSVKSNSRFFKAVKQKSYGDKHLSMPIGPVQKVQASNMPLNQINFRLTQHPQVQFAISASDNAIYQEFNTKERERAKKEKIDNFMKETQARVAQTVGLERAASTTNITNLELNIKRILAKAIEFSMKTNMIKKSGTNVDHDDVNEFQNGPPTFNDQETTRLRHTHTSTEKPLNVDLGELKSALEGGAPTQEIMDIVDKIIDVRDTQNQLQTLQSEKQTRHDALTPEDIEHELRNGTPEFDYAQLQATQTVGVPPRDFETYVPLLRLLHLENYDRNEFAGFDMIKSLKLLKHLWKTLDQDKIDGLLNYSIVHEVMKVEERKAVRRTNKGTVHHHHIVNNTLTS